MDDRDATCAWDCTLPFPHKGPCGQWQRDEHGHMQAAVDRWQPVPVPKGDGHHDIGDDVRAAIVERLTSDWSRDPDLTPEKARQLAMWAGAAVRALFHELGTLRDLAGG